MVASIQKRRRLRKKLKLKKANRLGTVKCKATKKSWNNRFSLKTNYKRLGLTADPNKDVKYAQFARHAKIRDLLMLKQAKSDLKWKMKSQAKILESTERQLSQKNDISMTKNANKQNNKLKLKWQIPETVPKIEKNDKSTNENNNNNNNTNHETNMKSQMLDLKRNLKKSQRDIHNAINKIDKNLDSIAQNKLDAKLNKNEKMTLSTVTAMSKHTGIGAKLPMKNTYLKRTLELAMNSMPTQVRHHLPQHKKEYFQRLIYKHGTNWKAMARDKQLNFFQLTQNRIKKDIEYNKNVFIFTQKNGQKML